MLSLFAFSELFNENKCFLQLQSINVMLANRIEISMELEITLLIEQSTVEDSGQYTVHILNQFGECTSSVEVVIVFELPTFTRPLTDVQTSVSQQATFEASFSGVPEPEVMWMISGMEISASERYWLERREQTTFLTILNVVMDDAEMSCMCRIRNAAGELMSTARLILIQGLSSILFK